MEDYQIYGLPVSGHYDCGYSYGVAHDDDEEKPVDDPQPQLSSSQPPPQSPAKGNHNSSQIINNTRILSVSRPRSPPTVLPNSFTTSPHSVLLPTPTSSQAEPSPSLLSPDGWSSSTTLITPSHPYGSDSELSTISSQSRQPSTRSAGTVDSSFSSSSYDKPIEPDPLPSHSNPQWLSLTQSAAFSGPRPVQPMRLCRRKVCEAQSGLVLFQLSEPNTLKLSRQAIYQVYEPDSNSIVGTLGYSPDAQHEVAVILRGHDVTMKKEGSSPNRWCFRPSCLTKKGAAWYWYRDKLGGDIVLADAKKGGARIAMVQRDVLHFQRAGLTIDTVSEICFSAMALAEMARRSASYEDAPSLAAAIAVAALGEASRDKKGDEISKLKRRITLPHR